MLTYIIRKDKVNTKLLMKGKKLNLEKNYSNFVQKYPNNRIYLLANQLVFNFGLRLCNMQVGYYHTTINIVDIVTSYNIGVHLRSNSCLCD